MSRLKTLKVTPHPYWYDDLSISEGKQYTKRNKSMSYRDEVPIFLRTCYVYNPEIQSLLSNSGS